MVSELSEWQAKHSSFVCENAKEEATNKSRSVKKRNNIIIVFIIILEKLTLYRNTAKTDSKSVPSLFD